MTIHELKNLKVGQLVSYTDSCDPLHIEFWTLASMSEGEWLMFLRTQCNNNTIIGLDDPALHLISAELEIGQLPITPDTDRQLRLIEAKIKDAEFDLQCMYQLQHTDTMSGKVNSDVIKRQNELIHEMQIGLINLRKQRNKLIEQI